MKILFATDFPEKPGHITGGVCSVAVNLVEGLGKEQDLDLHVLARAQETRGDRTQREGNVSVHFFESPRPKIATRLVREIPKIKRIIKAIQPDLVHAHLPDYVYPALQVGVPTVWTPHGVMAHQAVGWGTLEGRIRGFLYGHLEQRSLKKIQHMIAINPFIKQAFETRTKAVFHLIENPIQDMFFNISPFGSLAGRILFVGTIHPRKGLLYLVEALHRIVQKRSDVSLAVVGPTLDSAYLDQVCETVKEAGAEDRVTFLGVCAGASLAKEYESAQLVVVPSLVETAPLVVSEAMAAHRPVVATRVGGIPWMIRDDRTGFLVEPRDVEGLAGRILALLENPGLCEEVGERARKEAKMRFSRNEVIRRTRDVYQEAVNTFSKG